MKTKGMLIAFCFVVFIVCHAHDANGKEFYRTYEIIALSESGLTLQDRDGNVIEIDKDVGDYKVGYTVRYDSIRKRLHPYRWQDYEVTAISGDAITLQHKTGDTLTVTGQNAGKFKIGSQVRYDSVDNKLLLDEDSGQWRQYTVVAADRSEIVLESNGGQRITLQRDNNLYTNPGGDYIGRYKAGDKVRYNAATNQLRKGLIRTYDFQDYVVAEVGQDKLILVNGNRERLVLKNKYGIQLNAGDPVKYDRLNDQLKKVR